MEVTITHLRKNLFSLIEQAVQGEPLYFTHHGQRFQIVPEQPRSRLGNLTPLQIVNPSADDLENEDWKADMQKEWEKDWQDL